MKHPQQPIYTDDEGVERFRANPIITRLLIRSGITMNDLAVMGFSDEDQAQFAQLIGYSVGGYESLSYADEVLRPVWMGADTDGNLVPAAWHSYSRPLAIRMMEKVYADKWASLERMGHSIVEVQLQPVNPPHQAQAPDSPIPALPDSRR